MYDPTPGVWLSEDPIQDDVNSYRYAGNDPVNHVDPDGLAKVKIISKFWRPVGRNAYRRMQSRIGASFLKNLVEVHHKIPQAIWDKKDRLTDWLTDTLGMDRDIRENLMLLPTIAGKKKGWGVNRSVHRGRNIDDYTKIVRGELATIRKRAIDEGLDVPTQQGLVKEYLEKTLYSELKNDKRTLHHYAVVNGKVVPRQTSMILPISLFLGGPKPGNPDAIKPLTARHWIGSAGWAIDLGLPFTFEDALLFYSLEDARKQSVYNEYILPGKIRDYIIGQENKAYFQRRAAILQYVETLEQQTIDIKAASMMEEADRSFRWNVLRNLDDQ